MIKTKIAVIDDREDARKLVASVIDDAIENLGVENEWAVVESAPLLTMAGYRGWVNRENIGILIIDERLNEVPDASNKKAGYSGSDLVKVLRKQNKDLPIYGVTSYPDDTSLQEHFALFNEVVKRDDFTAKAAQYLDRFLRLYKTFLYNNEKELSELSKISKRIALGTASVAEKKKALAIQENLEIPLTTLALGSRKEWLDEYEKTISDFKKMQKIAKKFINKK